jgi:hypothetical protein
MKITKYLIQNPMGGGREGRGGEGGEGRGEEGREGRG